MTDDDRQHHDPATAELDSARRIRLGMRTLAAIRRVKQLERSLVNVVIEAAPFGRAALLEAPTATAPAQIRLHAERPTLQPLTLGTIPNSSPLARGSSLTRLETGSEDLFPLHLAMVGRGVVVPLQGENGEPTRVYVYADAYDRSIPIDEAERAIVDIADVAALARSRAALVAERDDVVLEARELARTDPLTGLPNRTGLIERMEIEIGRFARYQAPFVFAMIDVDRFKLINDSLGHAAGDQALIRFSRALQRTARDSDLPARFGGDEFAVILVDSTEDQAIIGMQRTLAAIHDVGLSASIGIAQVRAGDDASSIFKRADAALYRAKETGRNRVVAAASLAAAEAHTAA
jgi:diguanylate cyclase (GGDEF)-like protein